MLYARLQTSRPPAAGADPRTDPAMAGARRDLVDMLAGHPGFAGVYLLTPAEDSGMGALLSLWGSAADARMASERSAAARGGAPRPVTVESDVVYEVEEDFSGSAASETPRAAVLLHFDGPHGDDWVAAARFAHRARVRPAVESVPGLVRSLVLYEPESRSSAVVTLAVSMDTLAAMEKAVNATELLPGEDPALLTGPDRAVIHEVAEHRTP